MLSLVLTSGRVRQFRSQRLVKLGRSDHWLYPCSERRGDGGGGGFGRFLGDHNVLRGNCEGISSF